MKTVDLIAGLQATNSRLEKEALILKAWEEGNREFFQGASLAYDSLISFGITRIPEVEDEEGIDSVLPFSFAEFISLADKLKTRALTGNAALNAVRDAALQCDSKMWNLFYRPVLLKDMRCGITSTTVNKVLSTAAKTNKEANDYLIPVFSCQLAKDGEDDANKKKIKGKKFLDVKLDGVRLLTVVLKEDGKTSVMQFTRNGKLNENFPHLRKIFEDAADMYDGSMVFDGEVASTSFSELMTQVNRTENVDTGSTYYALFDIIPLSEFQNGKSKKKQKDRHADLIKLAPKSSKSVYVLEKLLVDLDTPEGKQKLKEFNTMAIAEGYEGIMVKEVESYYECKRSESWLKVKPTISVSLTAKSFQEGTGKFAGSLGAILFEGEDDGKQISVSVGSGLSDADRSEIWANKDKYLGLIGEVEADCFSLEQGATVYALRFPRFKGWRGSVPGEKI